MQGLEKRGQDHYQAPLNGGFNLVVIAAIINSISQLFTGNGNTQTQRRLFLQEPGACTGRTIMVVNVAGGAHPAGLQGSQTEHPIEVIRPFQFLVIVAAF